MVGTTLLHYRVLSALGSGGMGEVYVAEDTKLHRKVALKILPAVLAADAERLARFQREALAIAALNHPNVVTIFAVEEAGGQQASRVSPHRLADPGRSRCLQGATGYAGAAAAQPRRQGDVLFAESD